MPLAVCDWGPNWLYAALALHTCPAQSYQFDVRLGWVAPPNLVIGPAAASTPLAARPSDCGAHLRLELALSESYLDYGEAEGLALPPLPPGKGIVLSGKLPLWLWTGLARLYHDAPWIGIFQPQLGDQAVVVISQDKQLPPGSLIVSGME